MEGSAAAHGVSIYTSLCGCWIAVRCSVCTLRPCMVRKRSACLHAVVDAAKGACIMSTCVTEWRLLNLGHTNRPATKKSTQPKIFQDETQTYPKPA